MYVTYHIGMHLVHVYRVQELLTINHLELNVELSSLSSIEIVVNSLVRPCENPACCLGRFHYSLFWQNELLLLFEVILLRIHRELWLQQDGIPAHYALVGHEFLNITYRNKWIGWVENIRLRSKFYRFFVWRYFKERVYLTETGSKDLRPRILIIANEICSI